jgi:uncharacterized protein YraI
VTKRPATREGFRYSTLQRCNRHSAAHVSGLDQYHLWDVKLNMTQPGQTVNSHLSLLLAPIPPRSTSRRFHRWLLAVVTAAVLLLAACGPEQETRTDAQLTEDTQRIAQEFAANTDLEQARAALGELPVANANQWLIFVAEQAIADAAVDAAIDSALTKLSVALGLHSPLLNQFAEANGLLEKRSTTASAASSAQIAPIVAAPVSADPAVAPAQNSSASNELISSTTSDQTTGADNAQATEAPATDTPTAEPLPTATPEAKPLAQAASIANLRDGPGINYNLAGSLQPAETAEVLAKNATGDWWQVRLANGSTGWVFAALVSVSGSTDAVAVAADIPTPPPAAPTATPAPVVEAAPTATATPAPAPEATATQAAPTSSQPHFTLVQRRLWSKEENGGCSGQHLLRIHVLDANGGRINGVTLQGIYTGFTAVTGSQGKGDGVMEFDLYGPGEGFRVVRDNDGREATSDNAEGFTTISPQIDNPTLIGAGYCSDEADCQVFYNSYGCSGHHSWEATFKRNY